MEEAFERKRESFWLNVCQNFSFCSRALLAAILNGCLAVLLTLHANPRNPDSSAVGVAQLWTGYNFVLGFLVVFRTTHSYARFWEGAALLHQIRGEWFNAVSCLFAFSSPSPDQHVEVERFQNLVVRLASMLHCAALQQITVREIKDFQTIELDGIDLEALQFLAESTEKCEVILQWIQRLVVDASQSGVLPIAPPILSRVFQELSRGIVNFNNARKITDVPFPKPYTFMIKIMLAIQWFVTPLVAATVTDSCWLAGAMSMITVFAFWSTVHIAAEIENPYGDDANDLPLVEYQLCFNRSLLTLLDVRAQMPPYYQYKKKTGRHLGHREMSSAYSTWLTGIFDEDGIRVRGSARSKSSLRSRTSTGGKASTSRSTTGSINSEPAAPRSTALRSLSKAQGDGPSNVQIASHGMPSNFVPSAKGEQSQRPSETIAPVPGISRSLPSVRREIPPLSLEGVRGGGKNTDSSGDAGTRKVVESPQHRVVLLDEVPVDPPFVSEQGGKGYVPSNSTGSFDGDDTMQRLVEIHAESTGLGGVDGSVNEDYGCHRVEQRIPKSPDDMSMRPRSQVLL